MTLPLSHFTNLARLGTAGDSVTFGADGAQLGEIAAWSGVLSLEQFTVTVAMRRPSADRFVLDFHLTADVSQACVVTLAPVPAHLEQEFRRELHLAAPMRRKIDRAESTMIVLDSLAEEGPEEIDSPHFDLAAPALEEFVLALEPYPRCPDAAFLTPDAEDEGRQNPFAVLKGLKPGE